MATKTERTETGAKVAGAGALSLIIGAALGAAAPGWADGIRAAFGSSAAVTTSAMIATGFVLGAVAPDLPRESANRRRSLGWCLVGLGVVGAIVGGWGIPLGGALARVGGSLEAGAVGATAARALLAVPLLVPLGVLLGRSARNAAPALGGGEIASAALAALAVGASGGVLAARAFEIWGEDPLVAPAGSALLLGTGILLVGRGGPSRDGSPGSPAIGSGASAIAAGAVAFGVAAFAQLGPRAFSFAFGHELDGFPVVAAAYAAGLLLGAIVAAVGAHFWGGARNVVAAAAVLGGTVAAAIAWLGRFDVLPSVFLDSIESATGLDDVVTAGLRLAFGRAAAVGGGLGAGAVLLLVGAPSDSRARVEWMTRTGIGAALGAVGGVAFAHLGLGPLSLQNAIVGAALVVTVLAAVAAVAGSRRRGLGAAVAAGIVVIAVVATYFLPPPASRNLLPDRHFSASASGFEVRGWITFESDGASESVAVIRRGGARRLLVNGRLEAVNGLATRSQGILAHLPLTMHPSPDRVMLIGLGNGVALASAVSHPAERIDCLVRERAFVDAADTTFGAEVRDALDDGSVRVAIGDPLDLVARSDRYDVILNQGAGAWGENAWRLCTREFLELARARLEDDGLYCQWLGDSALTKPGFLSLLATLASVFPQVEVWAGHGSSVLLLAKKSAEPHDFGVIHDAYRTPEVQTAAANAWIPEPLSLLSYFLVSDEGVRRISARAPIHTRSNGELGRVEAARRRRGGTVNPVPGLFALGDDVLERLTNTPPSGFEVAVANAVQARALERVGLLRDAERRQPEDRQAVEIYENALQLNSWDRAIRRRLADLRSRIGIEFMQRESVMAAHSNLREAVEIDSTFAEGYANLGRHLAISEEYDFAVAVMERAIELEPDNDLFALLMGQIWKRRVYYDKALPWYEKAMELNPRNVDAAIGYVDTKLAMETNPDLEHGLEVSRRYLEIEPENEELRMRVSRLELAMSGELEAPESDPETDETAPADSAAS